MGLFDNIFGNNQTDNNNGINWITLETEDQLQKAIEASFQKPVVLFKHSTRCSISSMAKSRLERNWDFSSDDLDIYYLDLIAFRNVSNKIASDLSVEHASPQILVLDKGKVSFHTSHNDISVEAIQSALPA